MDGVLYLHGFASGPSSTKARYFRNRLEAAGAAPVSVPDLAPDFTATTLTDQLDRARTATPPGRLLVLGSSLGGFLASTIAERTPEAVGALVLFAPAYHFVGRFEEKLGAETVSHWEQRGTLPFHHHVTGKPEPLAFEFVRDSRRYPPEPSPACPTLIFAGRRDDLVPLAMLEAYAASRPQCQLIVFDSGHELTDVLDTMWDHTQLFLARVWPRLSQGPAAGRA